VRDAGLGDVVDLGLEAVVPASLLLVRLPVEPLLARTDSDTSTTFSSQNTENTCYTVTCKSTCSVPGRGPVLGPGCRAPRGRRASTSCSSASSVCLRVLLH
jgi:hypothetical protein